MRPRETKETPAAVVVALRAADTGRIYLGMPWEQHDDLRVRLRLGRRTDGWLTAGFVHLDVGDFLTRGQAARRFPREAGRARGLGIADSSDFACIRGAKLARVSLLGQHSASEEDS